MAGALIITAEFRSEDGAWLDKLRRAHYPPDRNRVPAHLTMFHALPPSAERDVRAALSRASSRPVPEARIDGLLDLGGGVAFRVISHDLDELRSDLARSFHGLLSAQDAAGWRPHVTIQNKVSVRVAQALLVELQRSFRARSLGIKGLGLHRYMDGPWEELARYSFRGR